MKVGFEIEAFAVDTDGQVVLVPNNMPMDSCGWLFEMRSQPSCDVLEAVFSLKADIEKVERQLARYNNTVENSKKIKMDFSPIRPVSKEIRLAARRRTYKGLVEYQNLYGHQFHRNRGIEATAGIHVSFTKGHTYTNQYGTKTVNEMFDFPTLFRYIDSQFKKEIKDAKRNPGFYEIKSDGRIEHRSLPNNINFLDLERTIKYGLGLIH